MSISAPESYDPCRPVPAIYRRIIAQCERRRMDLGWSCERLDDAAGLQSGHYAKLKNSDAKSGRCARWETLNMLMQALWPDDDFELVVLSTSSIAEAAAQRRGMFA